jgi:5-methylcytosine-specific restriction endonuclease McrA
MPQSSSDPFLDQLRTALESLAIGNRTGANEAIKAMTASLPQFVKRTTISPAKCAEVFRRDHWTCQYCGGPVVPSAILNAASLVWHEVIPYNPNWRSDATHPIFVSRSACVDHIEPHAHGGSTADLNNLVTACWPCNAQKGEFTLDRLGWSSPPATPRSNADWDGLVGMYPSLWEAASTTATDAQKKYHRTWLAALTSPSI